MDIQKQRSKLLAYATAEKPMPGAPIIEMDDGNNCIPQHYLEYEHTLDSIEQVIADISFSEKYPLFACEDESGLYIMVGVIGKDNYKNHLPDAPLKITYGRKWRVEPNLPSSEIIQTAFLAIKKAREHELRELLRLRSNVSGKRSTPFTGHHDTPVLAQLSDDSGHIQCLSTVLKTEAQIRDALKPLSFDYHDLTLVDLEKLKNGLYAITVCIRDSQDCQKPAYFESDVPEYSGLEFTILLERPTRSQLYHATMDEILRISGRYVDEKFKYRGFTRFSWDNDVAKIGEVSIALRDKEKMVEAVGFNGSFKNINYDVDSTRVPVIRNNAFSEKILNSLTQFGTIEGHMPIKREAS